MADLHKVNKQMRVKQLTAADKSFGGSGSGGGGGASAVQWIQGDTNNVSEETNGGVQVLAFSIDGDQEIWAEIAVPSSYAPGSPISLISGKFGIDFAADEVRIAAETFLIKAGSDVLGALVNSHDSVNAAISASATPLQVTNIGTLDLTDLSGLINGVGVSPLDTLLVRLYRDIAGESPSADADAQVIRNSFIPQFS